MCRDTIPSYSFRRIYDVPFSNVTEFSYRGGKADTKTKAVSHFRTDKNQNVNVPTLCAANVGTSASLGRKNKRTVVKGKFRKPTAKRTLANYDDVKTKKPEGLTWFRYVCKNVRAV